MKKRCYIVLIFIFELSSIHGQNSKDERTDIGPANGTLVIVGGDNNEKWIIKKFIELAGGKEAPIVIIPTAHQKSDRYNANSARAHWRRLGANNITVLHTIDRNRANSDLFVIPLMNAHAVWFEGGAQWKLAEVYKNTLTEKMMWKILERGGVIGGSSAGATIQGSFLVRGDTKTNQLIMGDHQEGMGFLKNVAIDPHLLTRPRELNMFEILEHRPELLGIGIDENTALIVRGNQLEVMGESYVIVCDGAFWSQGGDSEKARRVLSELQKKSKSMYQTQVDESRHFYFLRNGDKYDLLNRKIMQ